MLTCHSIRPTPRPDINIKLINQGVVDFANRLAAYNGHSLNKVGYECKIYDENRLKL